MPMNKSKKWFVILAVIFSCSLLWALTGTDIYKEISEAVRLYNEVFRQLLVNYVDELDTKELTETTVRDMLRELDPYTVFMTEEEKEPLDVLSKGAYGGVGLRISIRNDTLTVISAIEGTPGMRANILPGDQILKVDTVFTKGLDVEKAARLIRGAIGSKVDLLIRRPGFGEPKVYTLEREKIQVHAVTYSAQLKPGLGYIKLAEFSKGATAEIKSAIENLNQQNQLKSLILDLRSNPGGLLEEALSIAELFTNPGDTLLFTRGRNPSANRVFIAQKKPFVRPEVKLVVLIDGGSASASEIVAGIIQDLDRGLVIGSPSFGKGLVQTIFRINAERSLKITTAKYYIPSGRLIQKSDYLKNPKVVRQGFAGDTLFFSRNHRPLKGAGGIVPDVKVAPNTMPEYVTELWRQNMFFTFAMKYRSQFNQIPKEVDDQIIQQFREYLDNVGFHYYEKKEKDLKNLEKQLQSDSRFANRTALLQQFYAVFDSTRQAEFDANRQFIIQGLSSEFATLQNGLAGRTAADLKYDPVVAAAIAQLQDEVSYRTTLGYNR